jgi:hypothetical protein
MQRSDYVVFYLFELLVLELFAIFLGIGYLIFYVSFEWRISRWKSFRKVFVVCIAGYNFTCLAYQIYELLYTSKEIFGLPEVPLNDNNWPISLINITLSFHMVLIYVRTKTVLKGTRKSLKILNFLAIVYVLVLQQISP